MYVEAKQLEFEFIEQMAWEEEYYKQQLLEEEVRWVQVTKEMSIDAQDRSLEGQWIKWN